MGAVTVADILVTPLRRISLAEGDVLHGMKRDDLGYAGFGEAYFSIIHKDAVKAWKRHLRMTLNLIVPIGEVRFVFTDETGAFREERVGARRYARLTVPPGLWFGFQGLEEPSSLLMNVANLPHDPAEIERKDRDQVTFDWNRTE